MLSLRLKIVALAIVPLLASLACVATAVRWQQQRLARSEQALVRAEYMAARRAELRNYVQLAASTIAPLVAASTPATAAARQAEAMRLLGSLDYGSDGYFFVYDMQGRSLMHSRQPELVGQDLWNLHDPLGRATMQDLLGQARAGGGYVEYIWRKPSTGRDATKLGYVVALPQWNWMMGTGLYLDDIEATVRQLDAQVEGNVAQTLWVTGGVAVLALAAVSALSLLLNLREQRAADARLRQLGHRVAQSQEEERARLARELHDGASQTLVAAKLLAEAAADDLPHAPDAARQELGGALARINATLAEVRSVAHRLRPALLDTLGLPAALRHLGGEFDATLPVHVAIDGAEHPLSDAARTALYRIAQEALTNVAKHAAAQQAELALAFEPGGATVLRVADDGRGFAADAQPADGGAGGGIGLRNMRERVAAFGGDFAVESAPGHGTEIMVRLPPAA